MGLLDLKIVIVAVLTAALVLICRSLGDLAAPSSFASTAARAEQWSSASFTTSSGAGTGTTSSTSSSTSTTSSTSTVPAAPVKTEAVNDAALKEAVPPAPAAPVEPKVHKLCVMSRIHNQPRSLAEWLEYHAALGITRFYLVDDCSSDGGRTRAVMDLYQQEGLVRYFTAEDVTRSRCAGVIEASEEEAAQAEERRRQRVCDGVRAEEQPLDEAAAQFDQHMAGCAYACGGSDGGQHRPNENLLFEFMFRQATTAPDEKCEWLMVFDTDEYMTVATDLVPTADIPTYITDHEKRTNGFPILQFPWVIMGSGGQDTRPPGLLVDNFRKGHFFHWMLKTAGKTEFLETWKFSHWPSVKHVSNETSLAEYGFEIPRPFFKTLRDFAERNWRVEEPGEGTELRMRNVSKSGGESNETVECLFPTNGVFLKHYSWRSFEEFKAHRSQTRVKSDGQHDPLAVDDPRAAWLPSTHAHTFDSPCSQAYFNDFTALMADKTWANLAARRERWSKRHKGDEDYDYEAWIKDGVCGTGPGTYSGPFPDVEDWVIR